MAPTKLKIVAFIDIVLSLVMGGLMGLLFLGSLATTLVTSYLFGIMAIVYLISLIGWGFMFLSSILMLFGKKVGFYLLFVCWILNLPNIGSAIGMILYGWMYGSFYMLRNDDETRSYLRLGDSWLEKKEVKKEDSKGGKTNPEAAKAEITPVKKEEINFIDTIPDKAPASKPDPLSDYIADCRKKGYSDDSIKKQLQVSGYDLEKIRSYF